ncbi:SRPBCC family protein [Streptomyces sp. NPDC048202]|uniref:SRPBCC family protein n=1 Tax=Streptomyces sp. NPDC048202 TaxID=3365514 RepID=UPI0037244D33
MLITRTDQTAPITVFARTSVSPETAFAVIAPIDLSLVFKADRFFPGVSHIEGQHDAWDRAGESREPHFTDGSHVTERLTEYTAPHGFAYELTGFTNVLNSLAQGVRGEFSLLPDGPGTNIRWTYEFKPRPGRGWVLNGPFKPLWQRYMQRALDRMVDMTEGRDPR